MKQMRVDTAKSWLMLKQKIMTNTQSASGTYTTDIKGVAFHRYTSPGDPVPHFFAPVLILVVQGRKLVHIGSEKYHYGENICFVSGVEIPATSCVMDASNESPYLSISMHLDTALITEISAQIAPLLSQNIGNYQGAIVQEVESNLLDAFVRLTELTETPEQIPVMEDLLLREIHYRLLLSPFGGMLRTLNTVGSQSNQITKAIDWLKNNYKENVPIDELATRSNMAISTFHKYFKEITTVSPLQYQKRLRLNEAHRLMLYQRFDATQAAFSVGYESATQFTREYKRLFGEPPYKNILHIKNTTYEGLTGQDKQY